MGIIRWIEGHFWAFLLFAMFFGILVPLPTDYLIPLLKPELMLTLLLVFLKIDVIAILERIRDFRSMAYLTFSFLILSPLVFFGLFSLWDAELAIGVLLLMSVPAGTSAPVLTDILRGNAALAMSLTIVTSLLAPFTIPLLFHYLVDQEVAVNHQKLFWDSASMIFIPMVASVILKRWIPRFIKRVSPSFTAINILLLFVVVASSFGSQRSTLLANPISLLEDIFWMYFLSVLVHAFGFLLAIGRPREDRIAIIVERAYMNNGLAVVLAATSFPPSILILMVLSEIPWSTTLMPLRWFLRRLGWYEAREIS
jgi:BASS family bile acid:Na+ symporter